MDIFALKTEIDIDPLGRGYSVMNDLQVAADINTAYRSGAATVTIEQVRQYLITQIDGSGTNQRSSLDMIKEYAESGTVRGGSAGETAPEARRSGASMIWYMLQQTDTQAVFEVGDTNVSNQFIAIGPDGGNGPGALTGTQLNAINNMATTAITRGEELGLGFVKAGHVEQARAI